MTEIGKARMGTFLGKTSMGSVQDYRSELKILVQVGLEMLRNIESRRVPKRHPEGKNEESKGCIDFEEKYQRWYTESHAVIKQLLPDRLPEFKELYSGYSPSGRTRGAGCTIQDWLIRGRSEDAVIEHLFDDLATVYARLRTQLGILESVEARFESSLFEIRHLVQADFFDAELDAARELLRHGFFRPAGVVAGIVLEKHLAQVTENHGITTRKKNPTIGDFNELLKKGEVLDVPSWRNIQRLSDLRNLCSHHKEREPTLEDVGELVNGVEKYIKTLF